MYWFDRRLNWKLEIYKQEEEAWKTRGEPYLKFSKGIKTWVKCLNEFKNFKEVEESERGREKEKLSRDQEEVKASFQGKYFEKKKGMVW